MGGQHGIFFKDNSENHSGKLLTNCTGDFYITDILLQGGPVAMGWVGHPSELRWTLDG